MYTATLVVLNDKDQMCHLHWMNVTQDELVHNLSRWADSEFKILNLSVTTE